MTLDEIEKRIEELKIKRDEEALEIYELEEQKRCLTGKAAPNEFDNFMRGFMRCGL